MPAFTGSQAEPSSDAFVSVAAAADTAQNYCCSGYSVYTSLTDIDFSQ